MKQAERIDYSVLQNVQFPADIRKLNLAQLGKLARKYEV